MGARRCWSTPRRHRAAEALIAVAASIALTGGCNSAASRSDNDAVASTLAGTPSPTADAGGTTPPGTTLRLDEPAAVRFTPDRSHRSVLRLRVDKVTRGKIGDLKQFTLDPAALTSSVYYVEAQVANVGAGDLSNAEVPLFGRVSDKLVVPAVKFGSTYERCDDQPLPARFHAGDRARLCMVMLAPHHGKISEIQWRPTNGSDPISWRVR